MKFSPQNWTHHHTHRLFHLSLMACFGFALLAVIAGQIFFLAGANAGDIIEPRSALLTATVPGIEPGPSVIPSGGSFSKPAATSSLPSLESVPVLTVIFKEGQIQSKKPVFPRLGKEEFIDVVATQHPEFYGRTNIPEATVYLELKTFPGVRAAVKADKGGAWSWKSPVPVPVGEVDLLAVARSELDSGLQASASLKFYIELPPSQAAIECKSPTGIYTLVPKGVAIDVLARIPEEFKTVPPGEDLLARIKLTNFGSEQNSARVYVEYLIQDQMGREIMSAFEFVNVYGKVEYIKSFRTSPNLADGNYLLTVKVYTPSLVTVSADTFRVRGEPVLALGSAAKVDLSLVFQALGLLLFLFMLILYFEYNKISVLSSLIRRVSENDLRPEFK